MQGGSDCESGESIREKSEMQDEKTEKVDTGPVFFYMCAVSACPCIGPMYMDCKHAEQVPIEPLPKLNVKQAKKTGVAVAKRFRDLNANPPTSPNCAAPVQFEMTDHCGVNHDIPIVKNPDVCMTILTWCGPRCGAAAWISVMFIPGILASKGFTLQMLVLAVSMILFYVIFIIILSCCCPCLKFSAPPLRKVVSDVIMLKVEDKLEEKRVTGGVGCVGKLRKLKLMMRRSCKYTWAIIKSLVFCQFLNPKYAMTFSKTIFTMIFTEIFMAVSIWFYFAFRFISGSFTWSVFSMFSWVEELITNGAIRARLTFWDYPVFRRMCENVKRRRASDSESNKKKDTAIVEEFEQDVKEFTQEDRKSVV